MYIWISHVCSLQNTPLDEQMPFSLKGYGAAKFSGCDCHSLRSLLALSHPYPLRIFRGIHRKVCVLSVCVCDVVRCVYVRVRLALAASKAGFVVGCSRPYLLCFRGIRQKVCVLSVVMCLYTCACVRERGRETGTETEAER